MTEIAEMESPQTQDFRGVRTSKHRSRETGRLNTNTGEGAAFLRGCHVDESRAGAERKKIKKKVKK